MTLAFLTHVTTFHDHLMTLRTACGNTLMTWWLLVKTFWRPWWLVVTTFWQPLLRLMTISWRPLMTTLMTHLTTWQPSTNNYSSPEWEQVAKSMTLWWPWWLTNLTDNPTDLLWLPMWLHVMTPDNLSDNKKQPWWPWWLLMISDNPGDSLLMAAKNLLTTSEDSIWWYLSPKSKNSCLAGQTKVWLQSFYHWPSLNRKNGVAIVQLTSYFDSILWTPCGKHLAVAKFHMINHMSVHWYAIVNVNYEINYIISAIVNGLFFTWRE